MCPCLAIRVVLVKYEREWIHATAGTILIDALPSGWADWHDAFSLRTGASESGCCQEVRHHASQRTRLRGVDKLPLGGTAALVEKTRPFVHAGHQEHDLANLEDRYAGPIAGEPDDRLLAMAAQSGPQTIHREPYQTVTSAGAVVEDSFDARGRAAANLHACSAGDHPDCDYAHSDRTANRVGSPACSASSASRTRRGSRARLVRRRGCHDRLRPLVPPPNEWLKCRLRLESFTRRSQ
jgi:hypothetical protein